MPPVSPSTRARSSTRQSGLRLRSDPASSGFRISDYPFYLLNRIAGRYSIDMSDALKAIEDAPGSYVKVRSGDEPTRT